MLLLKMKQHLLPLNSHQGDAVSLATTQLILYFAQSPFESAIYTQTPRFRLGTNAPKSARCRAANMYSILSALELVKE